MSWHLAPSLVEFRAEVDKKWPKRSKKSDGTIGDAAHAARQSDHNPNSRGSVNAIDITYPGVDPDVVIAAVKKHPSANYVIFNRKIYTRSGGWKAEPYSGISPHTEHLHVSILQTVKAEQSKVHWFTDPAPAKPKPVAKPVAKPVVKPTPAKPTPAKPAPAKPVVVKPTPAKPAAKPAPAKPVVVKPTPAKPAAKPAPAKPVVVKPTPAKPAAKPALPKYPGADKFKVNSKNPAVKVIQYAFGHAPTGTMTQDDVNAVKSFQRLRPKLWPADGVIGQETYAALAGGSRVTSRYTV